MTPKDRSVCEQRGKKLKAHKSNEKEVFENDRCLPTTSR